MESHTEQGLNAVARPPLPTSLRYVKNGEGGRWWPIALEKGQVHAGWNDVPDAALKSQDAEVIKTLTREQRGNTQDLNALLALVDRPSQHVWITFQDGCLWWCTVGDPIEINPSGPSSATSGHFWLTCDLPWSRHSRAGKYLAIGDLPGIATTTAGFRGTVCEPSGVKEILRIINDEIDQDVVAAVQAREAYEAAVATLIARLRPKDFEQLTDLILSRDGWVRLGNLGGTTEGVDLEVENASAGEIAFVQVKSNANQKTLDDYVALFQNRRDRYARMIFVVHTPVGRLTQPMQEPVQIWDRSRLAELVVRNGLAQWVASKL